MQTPHSQTYCSNRTHYTDTYKHAQKRTDAQTRTHTYSQTKTQTETLTLAQDAKDALSAGQIAQMFELSTLAQRRECHILSVSAAQQVGLIEAMDWVCGAVRRARARADYVPPSQWEQTK